MVAKNDVVPVDEGWYNAEVGGVARGKCDGGFCAEELRHAVFEFGMRAHVSRDECRCYGAASIGVERFDGRAFEDGMVGEAQIVV